MNINKRFLPIKIHYFLFLGCVAPVIPFIVVVARQLGIPVIVQGTVGAIILVLTVILKPLVAAAADAFPKRRKLIFLLVLLLMVCSFLNLILIPPMHGISHHNVTGSVFSSSNTQKSLSSNESTTYILEESDSMFLLVSDNMSCYPSEMWDCKASCEAMDTFIISHILVEEKESILSDMSSNINDSIILHSKIYRLENVRNYSSACESELKIECEGALYVGETCNSLWKNPLFYVYLLLLTIGFVTYATGNSVTDAICMDLIGENGDYGNERAWGTVGWGLMGPISGFFIDWYSGDKYGKRYLPAFLILGFLGSLDVILSASKLKVPKIETDEALWDSIKVVMKKPSFMLFLGFVVMAGSFDGVVASYIFVLQEEMAKDTPYMRYMKFIQGLTIGAQCFFEAPFMWVFGWFLKRMGSQAVLSLAFFLYIFRLLGLALVGSYGPVWLTLVVEVLNGPCYGLGYTAIVVQAGVLTPPGTSTTVQSITNICYESLGYALASLLGGITFACAGAPGIYYLFAIMAIVTFILHFISIKCQRRSKDKDTESKAQSPLREMLQLKEERRVSRDLDLEVKLLHDEDRKTSEREPAKLDDDDELKNSVSN